MGVWRRTQYFTTTLWKWKVVKGESHLQLNFSSSTFSKFPEEDFLMSLGLKFFSTVGLLFLLAKPAHASEVTVFVKENFSQIWAHSGGLALRQVYITTLPQTDTDYLRSYAGKSADAKAFHYCIGRIHDKLKLPTSKALNHTINAWHFASRFENGTYNCYMRVPVAGGIASRFEQRLNAKPK
jgi:hypothetical protein